MLDMKVFLMLSFKRHKKDTHGIQYIIMIFNVHSIQKTM